MTVRLIPGDLIERAQVIGGLRQLADFLDDHPDIPVCPFGWDVNVYPRGQDEAAEYAEVDRIAASLGVPVTDDTPGDGHYTASRSFGRITYQAIHVTARRAADHQALMSYRGCVIPGSAEVAP